MTTGTVSPVETRFRSQLEEMVRWLEGAKPRRCFKGMDVLTLEAMRTALSAGIPWGSFDWFVAERGRPEGFEGWFERWPDLQSVEALRFRGPGGRPSALVVLDAWDGEGRPHRLNPRSDWGRDRRRVLLILRRWLQYLDERPPTEAAPADGDSILTDYLARHPDATEEDTAKAAGWGVTKLRKSKAWRDHRNARLAAFYEDKPEATAGEAAAYLGVAESTLVGMQAHKDHKAGKERKPPKTKEVPMTQQRIRRAEDQRWREAKHERTYTEDGGMFENLDTFRTALRNLFDGDDHEDTRYRSLVNRLKKATLEELLDHLKAQAAWFNSDSEKPEEQQQKVKLLAASWLERWEDQEK
jgi:hypothetical protein